MGGCNANICHRHSWKKWFCLRFWEYLGPFFFSFFHRYFSGLFGVFFPSSEYFSGFWVFFRTSIFFLKYFSRFLEFFGFSEYFYWFSEYFSEFAVFFHLNLVRTIFSSFLGLTSIFPSYPEYFLGCCTFLQTVFFRIFWVFFRIFSKKITKKGSGSWILGSRFFSDYGHRLASTVELHISFTL